MRIIIDIPDNQEAQVLAQMQALGYTAYTEEDEPIADDILESHLALIIERRKDPVLSQTKSIEEVFAKYDTWKKLPD